MLRVVAVIVFALTCAAAASSAEAAQKKASKPAERRPADDAQPADAKDTVPATTYEQELEAAREKRDKDLEDAAAQGADRRTLEKKKQEIFAQYATILAALRDKYDASTADSAPTLHPDPSRNAPKTKKGRPKPDPDDTPDASTPAPRKRPKKLPDVTDELAEAQQNLDDEYARHQAKLDDLNKQLDAARASDTPGDDKRIAKQIEKETTTHGARRLILERRIKALGGTPKPPPPAKTALPAKPAAPAKADTPADPSSPPASPAPAAPRSPDNP